MVLRIRLQTHQVHVTVLQYYTVHMHAIHRHKIIHTQNESKHSEMGLVRQNPIQRTVSLFMCVCSSLCTIVAHNTAQNRPDNFPSCPPDNHQLLRWCLCEGGGIILYTFVTRPIAMCQNSLRSSYNDTTVLTDIGKPRITSPNTRRGAHGTSCGYGNWTGHNSLLPASRGRPARRIQRRPRLIKVAEVCTGKSVS